MADKAAGKVQNTVGGVKDTARDAIEQGLSITSKSRSPCGRG